VEKAQIFGFQFSFGSATNISRQGVAKKFKATVLEPQDDERIANDRNVEKAPAQQQRRRRVRIGV
jgi:hypothetical protein